MNSFYTLPNFLQWFFAVVMFALMLGSFTVWNWLMTAHILNFFLIFILVPIGQFLVSPFFTLAGIYQYLSPMLLVFGASNQKYDLHNGTSFDYLLVMRGTKPGWKFQNKLLSYFIEGLLKVIDKIENGTLPETVLVRGSSYFFSEQTAKRLGFKVKETGGSEKFNIFLNYVDLIWMYSLSKGRLTFPSLKGIKTAEISGENLVNQKEKLLKLQAFLNR